MTHEIESAQAAATAPGAQDDRSGDAINIQDSGAGAPARLEFHPLADAFPLLEGEEFEELVEDIAANGLHEEIVIHEDKILDGRNRYRACRETGVVPRYKDFDGDDPAAYVISANIHRRHLKAEEQRPLIEAVIKATPEKSDRAIAKAANVSPTFAGKVRNEMEEKGEVPAVDTRVDAKGVKQPAKKKKKPRTLLAQAKDALEANPGVDAKQLKKLCGAPIAECKQAIKEAEREAEWAREEASLKQLAADLHRAGFAERIVAVDEYDLAVALRELLKPRPPTDEGDEADEAVAAQGNDVDPAESAEARKAEFTKIESAPAPKKKRGRPPGSKNKKKA